MPQLCGAYVESNVDSLTDDSNAYVRTNFNSLTDDNDGPPDDNSHHLLQPGFGEH